MASFRIRPLHSADGDKVTQLITERWGARIVVAHGVAYEPSTLPGFIACREGREDEWLGLITYRIERGECEIVTLDSFCPSVGIGTALVQAVKQAATEAGCKRLWLITTNDNLDALRFYQKRGFVLAAIHRGAVDKSRELKPEIPAIGAYGIPLRDEIELEMAVPPGEDFLASCMEAIHRSASAGA